MDPSLADQIANSLQKANDQGNSAGVIKGVIGTVAVGFLLLIVAAVMNDQTPPNNGSL